MESEGVVPINNSVFNPKMINHTIEIYYFPMSPPSRSVLLLMKALGLKHNINLVNVSEGEHMKPDFIKLNPLHQIPVIKDGDFILCDSTAIMKYLAEQYAKDDSLYPRDPKKGAIVCQRQLFVATYLFPRFVAFYVPTLFGGQAPDQDNKDKLEEALKHIDNYIHDSKWFAGDNMTVADFSIIPLIVTMDAVETFDLKSYSNLWNWYQRTKSEMSGFGFEEINKAGTDMFQELYKKGLQS